MIRGQKIAMAPKRTLVTIPITLKMHNRFDFEVRDARTGELKQKAYAENIVLNNYWTRLTNGPMGYVNIGTGTGTLDPARTALFTYLDGKQLGGDVWSKNITEGWVAIKKSAQWLETEQQNTAWTEIGCASNSITGYLCTHALIKDQNGNPVTISKGLTDIITVYATIYIYYPVAGFDNGNIMIPLHEADSAYRVPPILKSIVSSTTAFQYYYVGQGDLVYPSLSAIDSNSGLNYIGTTSQAYDAPNKKRSATCPRIAAASVNNPGGIKSIIFGYADNSPSYSNSLVVKIPCTAFPYSAIAAESIGTGDGSTVDFATDFPFVKNDSSFVLKKNGNTLTYGTDYTVDFGIPNQSRLDEYMKLIATSKNTAYPGMYNGFLGTDEYCIFENPFYATYGINTVRLNGMELFCSDSAAGPWTSVGYATSGGLSTSYQTKTIDGAYVNKRYWKIMKYDTGVYQKCYVLTCTALANKKNIHFVTAPAQGDTITADYRCEVIAKDANHVFDFAIEMTMQEHTS